MPALAIYDCPRLWTESMIGEMTYFDLGGLAGSEARSVVPMAESSVTTLITTQRQRIVDVYDSVLAISDRPGHGTAVDQYKPAFEPS